MIDEQLEFQISQYADGSLPAEELAALEWALQSDDEARATLEEYRKLHGLIAKQFALPAMDWHRIEQRLCKAVEDEDRATSTFKIGVTTTAVWWRRAAIAAVLLIAVGVAALWPHPAAHEQIAVNPPSPKPAGEAIVLVSGPAPEVGAGAPVEQISLAPSEAADQDNYLVAENIVYRPPRVVIASGDLDRQDTGRLPY